MVYEILLLDNVDFDPKSRNLNFLRLVNFYVVVKFVCSYKQKYIS